MNAIASTISAEVNFANLHTHGNKSQLGKLKRLIHRAGIE